MQSRALFSRRACVFWVSWYLDSSHTTHTHTHTLNISGRVCVFVWISLGVSASFESRDIWPHLIQHTHTHVHTHTHTQTHTHTSCATDFWLLASMGLQCVLQCVVQCVLQCVLQCKKKHLLWNWLSVSMGWRTIFCILALALWFFESLVFPPIPIPSGPPSNLTKTKKMNCGK